MPYKAELVSTAVGLGLVTDSQAKGMTKDDLTRLIDGATLEELNPEGSKGAEGKGKKGKADGGDVYEGNGEITPVPGHIMVVIQTVGSNTPGELLEVKGVHEHGIEVEGKDGESFTLPWSALGSDVSNTGFAPYDLVQLSDDRMGVITGISKKSDTVAVRLFKVHDFKDSGANISRYFSEPNDADHPLFTVEAKSSSVGSKVVGVVTDDIKQHWSMSYEARYELTQEGADYISKLATFLNLQNFPLPDPNDTLSVVSFEKVSNSDSGKPPSADSFCAPHLRATKEFIEGDEHEALVDSNPSETHAAMYKNAMNTGNLAEPTFMPFPITPKNFIQTIVGSNYTPSHFKESAGAFHTLSIHMLEAKQPRQQEQDEQSNSQSQEMKEGIMEESRKSLADMKGTPDNPKKESTSAKKIKSLVEETVANTESLEAAVTKVIEKKREELRDVLGINKDLETLGNKVLDDIEGAFKDYSRELDSWKHAVEQKITTRVKYNIPEMPEVEVTDPHHTFDDLLFNAVNRLATLLVGPSGSGKTKAAQMVAEVLGLPFGYIPLGPTQTEAKFAGYPDAQGNFVPTEFYLKYRYGGVILLDEMDAGNPSVLVWINGAIQNKTAAFPRGFMTKLEGEGFSGEAEKLLEAGGMVDMHPDCVVIASANTFGRGADLIYQGRNALDGATLKRFKVLIWDYDEVLERKLAGDDLWVSFVQSVRSAVNDLQMHHIVSPVDSIDGARMIAAGQDWQKVSLQTVFAGLQKAQIKKIFSGNDTLSTLRTQLMERQAATPEGA